MPFCRKCGKEIEETDEICPYCGEAVSAPEKKKLEVAPLSAISFVFSAVAFIFGFILTTTFFVTKRGIAYAEYSAIIPSLAGLGLGIYCVAEGKCNKVSRLAAIAGIIFALFTLLYVFIGFMVVAA